MCCCYVAYRLQTAVHSFVSQPAGGSHGLGPGLGPQGGGQCPSQLQADPSNHNWLEVLNVARSFLEDLWNTPTWPKLGSSSQASWFCTGLQGGSGCAVVWFRGQRHVRGPRCRTEELSQDSPLDRCLW